METAAQTCTSAPSEALGLHLIGANPTQLLWGPPADPGGTQTVAYDVLRSPAPDGFLSSFCLASGVTAVGVGDAVTPVHIFYYLVRAKNGCGGTLGTDSSGNPTSGASCLSGNGGACLYDNECSSGSCCAGFCSDLSSNPDHCGGCANICSSNHMATRTCGGGVCNGACAAGFANCDGNALTNGCECAGNLCCGTACPPPHVNGLGQSFDDCTALGVPGNPATYTVTLANEARAAWPFTGINNAGTCGTGGNAAAAQIRQTPSSCAVWVYQKTLAGFVHLNSANNSCICPTNVDPTWK
jgi:hypothetical protein